MIAAICSKCKTITGLKEESKPGLFFSHTYCLPCGEEVIRQINCSKVILSNEKITLQVN